MVASSLDKEARRPLVFILEDDDGVRRSLQLLLRAEGFSIKAYAGVHFLLADPDVFSASCLIADYRLPEVDGIAVLDMLRKRGWAGPALLMTAYGSAEVIDRARKAGFVEVLEKPFMDHSLLNALRRANI